MRLVVLRSPVKVDGWDSLWAFDSLGSLGGEPAVLRSEWLKKGFAGSITDRRLADDLKPDNEVTHWLNVQPLSSSFLAWQRYTLIYVNFAKFYLQVHTRRIDAVELDALKRDPLHNPLGAQATTVRRKFLINKSALPETLQKSYMFQCFSTKTFVHVRRHPN